MHLSDYEFILAQRKPVRDLSNDPEVLGLQVVGCEAAIHGKRDPIHTHSFFENKIPMVHRQVLDEGERCIDRSASDGAGSRLAEPDIATLQSQDPLKNIDLLSELAVGREIVLSVFA